MDKRYPVRVTVNDKHYEERVEARLLLSDFLRHELNLTGTHVGCEHGSCGACTVLMDMPATAEGATAKKVAVRSCIMFAVQANGHAITTVEGLTPTGDLNKLHPLQVAFREKHGLQCGYCTPGLLMTLLPFLAENPDPTDDEIRDAIAGNLCRCTGYQNIVEAVKWAVKAATP